MINPKETPGEKGEVDVKNVIASKVRVVEVKLKKLVEAKVEMTGKHGEVKLKKPVEAKVEMTGKHVEVKLKKPVEAKVKRTGKLEN